MGLLLKEIDEVGLDGLVIRPGGVTDGGQKTGALGIMLGDLIRVESVARASFQRENRERTSASSIVVPEDPPAS